MIGILILILVVGGLVGGFAAWTRQNRRGLPRPAAVGEAPPRRISLLMEAIGYIGTILVLAGGFAFAQQHWTDISEGGRLAILAVGTGIFLGIGAFVLSSTEPALRRLAAVTWAVSVGVLAGALGMVNLLLDTSGKTPFLTIATPTAAYAVVLWLVSRHGVQQAVAFAASCVAVASVVNYLIADASGWMIALPLWGMGIGWAAAGWWRRVDPWFVAVPLGLLVALGAPATMDPPSGLRFGLGIATATAVMTFAVLAKVTPALAMGAVAELGYVIGAVTFYFGDTLGVPASLSIAGLLILLMAAAAARWHWFTRRPPAPSTPEEPHVASQPRELTSHH
ncbi:MAG TPA: hypothetical protein VFH66_00845 [Mycobacteriales bacterium]|nr:hypothetical protein [Mycobacteriales bacterium]